MLKFTRVAQILRINSVLRKLCTLVIPSAARNLLCAGGRFLTPFDGIQGRLFGDSEWHCIPVMPSAARNLPPQANKRQKFPQMPE